MRYEDPELTNALAAEYVLGTLTGAARRRFEGLLHARPALRRQVRDWELELNRLAAQARPVAPPPQSWQSLEQRLFPQAPAVRTSWLQELALWRGLSVAGLTTSLVLAGLLFYQQRIPRFDRMAVIAEPTAQPVWMLKTADNMDRIYVTNMKPMALPAGKACLLWLRPKGSQQYYAVGTLPDQGEQDMLMLDKKMPEMMEGDLIVTVEERDETMPDAPSGSPVFQGTWL